MDAFLIIVAIVACGMFLLVDLYLLAIYSHKEETNLSAANIFCKVLIMLTLLQMQLQPLFLVVDVVNSRTSTTDLTLFWVVLYFSILINIAFLKPLATSIYERDHDHPCWKSTLWIIAEVCITILVFGCFVGIGWLFWGNVSITVPQISIDATQSVTSQQINALEVNQVLTFQVNAPCFLMALFCLIGYPMLSCCGACGLTALPLSLILDFVYRPQYRRTADAKKVADFLKQQTIRLLSESESLKRNLGSLDNEDGFFKRRKANLKFQSRLHQVQNELQLHRDYFQLFQLELEMQQVNPLVFVGKLLLGILCAICSCCIWFQILFSQLVYPISSAHGSIFIDRLLSFLEAENANFVSVGFLMLLVIFVTCCVINGAVFFSNSIPLITIHPIKPGKTWLNSFLFHLVLCVLSSCSLIHLLLKSFPYYLRGGEISLLMNQLMEGMTCVGFLIRKQVFTYCFLIIGGLGIVYVTFKMICGSQAKGDLLIKIEAKREKLFGKNDLNRPIKYIEMTQMNLKAGEEQGRQPKGKKDKKSKRVKLVVA